MTRAGRSSRLWASLAEDAELVAFRVCQDDPRLVALTDVNALCTLGDETSHLGGLVVRPEVEVQAALGLPALVEPDELQPWQEIDLRTDLALIRSGADDDPSKSVGPPLPEGDRVCRDTDVTGTASCRPRSVSCSTRSTTSVAVKPLVGRCAATWPATSARENTARHAPAPSNTSAATSSAALAAVSTTAPSACGNTAAGRRPLRPTWGGTAAAAAWASPAGPAASLGQTRRSGPAVVRP